MHDIKSGFVAIVGRPNVGKSTLINALIGQKIAIMSPKPQTTRHRITGVYTKDKIQIVFVDTPGMHKGKELLNQRIDKVAVSTLSDVDVILFVVDRKNDLGQAHIIQYFKNLNTPVILVINKIDELKDKKEIDEIILSYLGSYPFKAFIPVSALSQTHLNHLIDEIKPHLQEGPMFYPEEMKTDQTEEQLMAELIREKILFLTEEEVPHATAVVIEKIAYNKALKVLDVQALIIVERSTQKQILIGKNGDKIKEIGTRARKEINRVLDVKVHLEIWVKVVKDWRNKPNDLLRYGYGEE